ncbi:MAG: beta strand repeat-containing protein, partial [Dolichospermum sp.]
VLLIAAGGTTNVTVGGNYSQTGGLAVISRNGGGARSMSVTGNVTISGGTLDIDVVGGTNAYTLNVGGNLDVQSGGTLTGSFGTRTIVFNGTGAQQFSVTGTFSGTVGLELNNTNGLTINNAISVGGTTVRLTAGTITHSGNLTILTGATITRTAGNFATAPTFGGTVSLTYANASPMSPGNEMPGTNVIAALSTAGGSSTLTLPTSLSITTLTVSGSNVTINSGVTVTASSTGSISATKTLQIDGTYIAGAALTNSGTMNVGSTGTYRHAHTTGTIPTATWATGSTCEVTGAVGGTPAGLGQSFHHFTWNCTGQTGTISLGGLLTTINGDFNILSTGTISGSNNGLRLLSSGTGALDVLGNLNITSSGSTDSKLDICGGGTMVLNLFGNVTINQTANTAFIKRNGGTATINFKKASGTQTITSNAATGLNTNPIVFNVGTGGTTNTLQMASDMALNATSTVAVLSGSSLSCGTYV